MFVFIHVFIFLRIEIFDEEECVPFPIFFFLWAQFIFGFHSPSFSELRTQYKCLVKIFRNTSSVIKFDLGLGRLRVFIGVTY